MPDTPTASGALFEQLRPRLTAISCRIVGSVAEAEDIVQDCYFKWHRTDPATLATPVAWLTTVVQHRSIDRLRQRTRDATAHSAMDLAPGPAPALPEDALLRRAELAAALARMLASLSPAERMALVLHEVFDCSHADIAAALGTTAVNARQYLARARRRLRLDRSSAPAEKLCRALIRRFEAAINGRDVPAMLALLADEQPVSVHGPACANDALYRCALAA